MLYEVNYLSNWKIFKKKGSTEDDLEMAATYDDEFGDMGAGSNLMCNLKMEIAALDATKATLKSKDEKSATNSGKTAPQKRAGRKRNELACELRKTRLPFCIIVLIR